jgi:nucleotide-binding universal stress UspA family protein
MTILCATDFSEPARAALEVAVVIAKKRAERLLIWHAVEPMLGEPSAWYLASMRTESAERLLHEAERIRALGVEVETDAAIGTPDDQLPPRMPPDTTLIVAGARGHTRGTHWLIGSVVERLARVVTVPLLVVREAKTLLTWLDGMRKLSVIVATDLDAVSDFALHRAAFLRDLGACNLELLYIEYPPGEYARLGVTGPVCVHKSNPMIEAALTRELEKRVGGAALGGEVTTRIARTLGGAGAFIAEEAEKASADLVVVGSHQRKALSRLWQGSIAHAVLHSAETNVLIVPFHATGDEIRALEPPALGTVVAATDLSSCGNRAVAWAVAMAPAQSRVVILPVVPREKDTEEAAREVERLKSAVHKDSRTIDTSVLVGKDVAETICFAAERVGADAVVIGHHGRGRTASEVLLHSRRPVLVVPSV